MSSSKRTRIDVECPDCKGTRRYTGFDTVEPCKTCAGVPDEVDEEDKTTEEIDTELDFISSLIDTINWKLHEFTDPDSGRRYAQFIPDEESPIRNEFSLSIPILWEDDVG